MKPSAFEYVRPADIAEAARILADGNGTARVVAGCQSLGPMLNLRLATPQTLVDLTGIAALKRLDSDGDSIVIGACVTHANIEDGRLPGQGLDALARVARNIAYRAVRNRGTIGGSLCHADPAADWVTTLAALDAECLIATANGRRTLAADAFVTGAYENALQPGELLEAIRIRRLSARGRLGYYKVCRKAGEFASAMGAVLHDPDRQRLRAVIGATHGRPIVIPDLKPLVRGNTIDPSALSALLAERKIVSPVSLRQQTAALTRAFQQTLQ